MIRLCYRKRFLRNVGRELIIDDADRRCGGSSNGPRTTKQQKVGASCVLLLFLTDQYLSFGSRV